MQRGLTTLSLMLLCFPWTAQAEEPACNTQLLEAQKQIKVGQYFVQLLSEERGRAQVQTASLNVQTEGLKAEIESLRKELERLKALVASTENSQDTRR